MWYALIYLAAALLCAFFGAVYERFSHEVYSYSMIYAFAVPLGLGALPLMLCGLLAKRESRRQEDVPADRDVSSYRYMYGDREGSVKTEESEQVQNADMLYRYVPADRAVPPVKDGPAGDADRPRIFRLPGDFSLRMWNSGVAALTVGCIFRGVLEIYGTTNRLIAVYPAAAVILLAAGLVSFLMPAALIAKMRRNA